MTCSAQWQESTDVTALIDHFEGFEEGSPHVEMMLDRLYMLDDLIDQLRRQHFEDGVCVTRDNLLILERFFSRHEMALARSIIQVEHVPGFWVNSSFSFFWYRRELCYLETIALACTARGSQSKQEAQETEYGR